MKWLLIAMFLISYCFAEDTKFKKIRINLKNSADNITIYCLNEKCDELEFIHEYSYGYGALAGMLRNYKRMSTERLRNKTTEEISYQLYDDWLFGYLFYYHPFDLTKNNLLGRQIGKVRPTKDRLFSIKEVYQYDSKAKAIGRGVLTVFTVIADIALLPFGAAFMIKDSVPTLKMRKAYKDILRHIENNEDITLNYNKFQNILTHLSF